MTTEMHLTGGELLGPGQHRSYSRAEMHGMGFLARYRNKRTRDNYALALRQWFRCHTLRGRMGGPGDASTSPALVRTCLGGPNVSDDMRPFWSQVDRGDDSECWLWQGAVQSRGYGRFRSWYVHRLSYEIARGPIPEGLTIDHLCCVKLCVNPAHLEAVTLAENHRRYVEATRDTCPHGHPKTPDNIYVTKLGVRRCQECRRINQRSYVARKRGAA